VYSGTFYHSRDPRPLLDALAGMRRRRDLASADLRVDFVGRCRTYDESSVEAMVAERDLADVVHFHDWMPQADAQAIARDADLLVLIAHDQPLQVPNKLFDYLGTRRRILALVDDDGESARMLRQVGGHLIVPVHDEGVVDAADIERALETAYDATREGRTVAVSSAASEATLQGWLSSRQMRRLVEAISA
jgi:glycosyltransferase involved in cell wall biosynthesis